MSRHEHDPDCAEQVRGENPAGVGHPGTDSNCCIFTPVYVAYTKHAKLLKYFQKLYKYHWSYFFKVQNLVEIVLSWAYNVKTFFQL